MGAREKPSARRRHRNYFNPVGLSTSAASAIGSQWSPHWLRGQQQSPYSAIDRFGFDQRLIALHIDDDLGIEIASDFRRKVTTTRMIVPSSSLKATGLTAEKMRASSVATITRLTVWAARVRSATHKRAPFHIVSNGFPGRRVECIERG